MHCGREIKCRRGGLIVRRGRPYWLVGGRQVARVTPGEVLKAEVKDAVELVEGDAHVKAGFSGGQTIAACLLHDGQGVEVEPADSRGVDGANGVLFFGFEPGAKW